MIEEDERPDHAALPEGEDAIHREAAAEVGLARVDHEFRHKEDSGGMSIGNAPAAPRRRRRQSAQEHDERVEKPHHRQRQEAALELLLARSEEHTSELQSLMRISYAVFCLKQKK